MEDWAIDDEEVQGPLQDAVSLNKTNCPEPQEQWDYEEDGTRCQGRKSHDDASARR